MQFNGVNNKENQHSLVVSSFCICTCVGIPCALCLRHSCMCFELEFAALFGLTSRHPGNFPTLSLPLSTVYSSGFSGFASHGSSLHLGAGFQQCKLLDVSGTQPPLSNLVVKHGMGRWLSFNCKSCLVSNQKKTVLYKNIIYFCIFFLWKGVVSSMKESFGFIERADKVSEVRSIKLFIW